MPLLRAGLIAPEDILIDAKSGVSGAGRTSDSYRATTELTWLTKKETACGFQTNESELECFTPKAT